MAFVDGFAFEDSVGPGEYGVPRAEFQGHDKPRLTVGLKQMEAVAGCSGLVGALECGLPVQTGQREVLVEKGRVATECAPGSRVVVVAHSQDIGHVEVEQVQAVRGIGPLVVHVVVDDVAFVDHVENVALCLVVDDPLRLGVEDLRVGGGVVLGVWQGDQSPRHTCGRTRLWLRSGIRVSLPVDPFVGLRSGVRVGLHCNVTRGLRVSRIDRGHRHPAIRQDERRAGLSATGE